MSCNVKSWASSLHWPWFEEVQSNNSQPSRPLLWFCATCPSGARSFLKVKFRVCAPTVAQEFLRGLDCPEPVPRVVCQGLFLKKQTLKVMQLEDVGRLFACEVSSVRSLLGRIRPSMQF